MNSTKQKKLHIAVIRQKYTPHGGAERFVDTMLQTLNQHAEVEVTLITRKWKQSENPPFNIIECNPFYLGRLWRDWSFTKAACAIIKEHSFDLVQSHERTPCADIYRAGDGVHREWLYQRQRVRSWWDKIWLQISPYHQYLLKQEKENYESDQLLTIIANSEITKQEIIRHFPDRRAKVTVIANAVDQEKYSPSLKEQYRTDIRKQHNIPDDAYALLFVGSGYERKGVNQLITTLSQLPPHFHLVIIGKDRHQDKFKTRCAKLGLSTRVHILGPQQDVRPFLGAADLFAFPSLYDPLPNSTLEAAASGLPVLASNTTGAADLTTGIGISAPDPLDTTAWVSAINTLSERNPIETNDMSPYKGDTMANKLTQLYQETLERKDESL